MFRRLLLLTVLAAALAGSWAWWRAQPAAVTVAELRKGTAAEVVYATGIVEPEHWAKVASLMRERIVFTCGCEGERVEQGALLFRLDDSEVRARLAETRARLDFAERELLRAADLLKRGVGSAERYEKALADAASLRAAVAALESELADHEIRAPLAGQVLRLDGEVGEVAEPGRVLAWVGQPRPLIVTAEVNEEDIPRVAEGQRALIKADAFPGEVLEARVKSITPKGDPVLRTYRVRLALPDDTPLLIGMSVDVNIVTRVVEEALLAPAPALIRGHLQVVGADGRIELRPVEVGIRGAEFVEITAGAQAGERVVSPARDDLAPGTRVRIAGS